MAATNQWVRLVEISRRMRAGEYPNAHSPADQLSVEKRMVYTVIESEGASKKRRKARRL